MYFMLFNGRITVSNLICNLSRGLINEKNLNANECCFYFLKNLKQNLGRNCLTLRYMSFGPFSFVHRRVRSGLLESHFRFSQFWTPPIL